MFNGGFVVGFYAEGSRHLWRTVACMKKSPVGSVPLTNANSLLVTQWDCQKDRIEPAHIANCINKLFNTRLIVTIIKHMYLLCFYTKVFINFIYFNE